MLLGYVNSGSPNACAKGSIFIRMSPEHCEGCGFECEYFRKFPAVLFLINSPSTLFYLGAIFFAGLLVPANDPMLGSNTQTASSSPFVIAFEQAGVKIVSTVMHPFIDTLNAWMISLATSSTLLS